MTLRLEFFYEFASTYSYLSVMRIEALAQAAGTEVVWRPFLLGPIFKSQGWATSPFNIYPAKGRYMVRDITRIAAARGLTFTMPKTFPANGLKAARLATAGLREGWTPGFSRAVFRAAFEDGADIADPLVLASCLRHAGADPDHAMARADAPDVKDDLRAATDRAITLGVFGAPSFVTAGGELFWGDDRLEQALAWPL